MLALAQPAGAVGAQLKYVSPSPGSRLVPPTTTIAVGAGVPLDGSALSARATFEVTGATSGSHAGTVTLSDDRRVLIFKPFEPFAAGEQVAVRVWPGLRTSRGTTVEPRDFDFQVGAGPRRDDPDAALAWLRREARGAVLPAGEEPIHEQIRARPASAATLPPGWPTMYPTLVGPTAPGHVFIADVNFLHPFTPFLMVLDDTARPVAYLQTDGPCFGFTVQPNGELTWYDQMRGKFYAADANFSLVDSFACGNGYSTDLHELRLLPNGHALLFSYDTEPVNMSEIVPGGDSTAQVTGLIIQELDTSKNVVFQWRSWDHFQITDATHENLTASAIDYVHGNALEVDQDGNLVLSSRHMDEITKIDHTTGDILWRWGGKHNQFTFINDTLGFSHQHALRRLDDGDWTMFDNGNYHPTPESRALEYALDPADFTATLMWHFAHNPALYGSAMGYVQRLPDGNTLIGWGLASPAVTEVTPEGAVVFELTLPFDTYSYRAYRIEWEPAAGAVAASRAGAPQALEAPAPDPCSSKAALAFDLPRGGVASVAVYDLSGRRVETVLPEQRVAAGRQQAVLDARHLASGVYFCKLQLDGQSWVRRITVLH